ncbi:alcohol dehydrogenase (NADP+) [Pseudohyphozyma bogoriensis]|nr:alcohol dehydrogenase (NADP+) [Pseudohyphozyma bogoriensis]
MSTDYKFSGWGAFSKDSIKGELKKFDYEPKKWSEEDVDIKIMYSGICASDLHTMSGGWGEVDYPQNDSCLECSQCKAHREPYCDKGQVGTYAGKYYREGPGKGDKSYGGYADYHRAPGHFVIPIPDGLDPALAAPMLCGGVTVYSPLTQYGAGTTAKDVGIVGIGGLGHFGLLFAKALGANVTAISHSESKKADAEKMGATRFIATHNGGAEDFAPYKRSLDLIVATTNDTEMPLEGYLSLLRPGGNLILVGAPEKPLPSFAPFLLLMNNVHIGGSAIGSPAVIKEMLALAAKQEIHPWIIKRPIDDVNEAVKDMHASKARYRYVLVNEKNGGKL